MTSHIRHIGALLCIVLYPALLFGQADTDGPDAALQSLTPNARAAVRQGASGLSHVKRGDPDVQRTIYSPRRLTVDHADPESAARAFLRREHRRLGLSSTLDELRLAEITASPGGHHVVFQQMSGQLPVYQGSVKVNLDRSHQPISAYNSIYDRIGAAVSSVQTSPSIPADRARQIVRGATTGGRARTSTPELFLYPSTPPRPVWEVVAWPAGVGAEWVMLIDAQDGSIVYGFNAATRLHETDEELDRPRPSAMQSRPRPSSISGLQTDGSGLVFDPDPLTTAGVTYGGPFVDDGDSDSEALAGELFAAPLRGLHEQNGIYSLNGPYVRIVGTNPSQASDADSTNYTPPAEPDPDDFVYSREQSGFEAVNAYYHVDKSQRYLQRLDPGFADRPSEPVKINPHGEDDHDNSFYYPNLNLISFGEGGVDDAEDANVIWHEYGHVLLESTAPGLLDQQYCGEARAFHEGWGDYWAASYRRSLAASPSGLTASEYDWRELFPWDSGNGALWVGRRVTHQGRYPADLQHDCYSDGLLWATTLMEIFSTMEAQYGTDRARGIVDRINLQSHYLIPNQPQVFTFRSAAHALLQADLLLYEGRHRFALFDHLQERGFIRSSEYGPQLSMSAGGGVAYDDGTLHVEVVGRERQFPIQTVLVHWRRLGAASSFQTAVLTAENDSLFTGDIAVSDEPGLIEYYIDASDESGIPQILPAAGPEHPFIARVGNVSTSDLMTELRSTGNWHPAAQGFQIDSTTAGTHHLVFEPVYLAQNNDVRSYAVLEHRYPMGDEVAGNVKISTDGGQSWTVLQPHTGYPVAAANIPELQGEPVFSEERNGSNPVRSVFDLSDYGGRRIQLRLDFASTARADERIHWHVRELTLYQATRDAALSTSAEVALHPNYPNPFAASTTVHFTLPSSGLVTLELYDVLGRRVRIIRRRSYDAGTHTLDLPARNLANGIYFLRLSTSSTQLTRPVRIVQ